MTNQTNNQALLNEVIGNLSGTGRVDRRKCLEALVFALDTAANHLEQGKQLSRENTILNHNNNTLAWMVINLASAAEGRLKEYGA
ncbi:MAG: hypothetical protein JJE30_14705 [Desulfuromonadales bacterium]|nr:hypothetical protein [Desulfuromonadales bacterium]